MLGSSLVEKAVRTGLTEPVDTQFNLLVKTVTAVEQKKLKPTNRLCGALTALIRAIKTDASLTSDQIDRLADYDVRVRKFNPRTVKPDRKEDEPAKVNPSTPKPLAPTPDGFIRGFIDPLAALSRVRLKYGEMRPRWTDLENENLLQVAIGESVPLDEHSARQCWLAFAYYFVEQLKCVEEAVRPQVGWITSAICSFVNKRGISIPRANCFATFAQELSFR